MKKANLAMMMSGLMIIASQVTPGWSLDVNEKITFEGTFTGVYQWLDGPDIDSKNRGSGAIDLGLSFTPTENNEFYILGSFASGNGLKDVSPFILAPNADDLEDDVKNINGHEQQDNILEAWYAHTFNFNKNTFLKITAGIIDATVYIDDNRFANDEITQFMNDVFVNTPLTTPPSYDLGAVLEFEKGPFTAKFLGMTTKDGEEGPFYQYYALQLGYTLNSKWGEGNYRIFGFITSEDFDDWSGNDKENLQGIGVSIDQDLGFIRNPFSKNSIGFFLRAGWQDDDAKIDYNNLISFGFNVPFCFLGKEGNEFGIGYAYLDSPNDAEISNTHAVEAYAKFELFSYEVLSSDLTVDFQYLADNYANDNDDKEGYILGFRWNLAF
ncbi:MAG: carbohydrate porin [Thermodesulfobacterium sp.]|nr:carbohydrate porin [Thermodesulfobacterium sp.]